jgi:tetratricopeptide (TPR) repeat protein
VGTLDAYSFVTKQTAESALDLHQLVHASIRSWLQKQGLLSQWTQRAITRLLEVIPDDNHGSRSKWRRLLPHAKFVLSSGLTGQDNEPMTSLIWRSAMTLLSDGRWKEAEELFVQAMEAFKRMLGNEHPHTLISMASLAVPYMNQGRWKEAERLFVQAMEAFKRVFGDERPDTLTCIGNLAATCSNQGRWKEAEELQVQVMETGKRMLGDECPHTLISVSQSSLASGEACLRSVQLIADCPMFPSHLCSHCFPPVCCLIGAASYRLSTTIDYEST